MEKKYSEGDLEAVRVILNGMLGTQNLGPDEDIYAAGLTSIMALPLLAEMEDSFAVSIPDAEFLDARTPRALAQLIQTLKMAGS